ncbi:hypothetical protein M6I34_06940 [Burkholderiaceae bacterium FT117]|uniref:DUF7693 family protein n=1 Tax=Zeimonas sediminis TaxID=2944268 RepID=UPI002342C924|nr:hypothetical protein [Zeimonas sediminis]MCM5570239.1 hypothetical protein [Zeimonas sediminis]
MSTGAGAAPAAHLPAAQAAAVLRELVEGARPLRLAAGGRPFVTVAVGEWLVLAGDAEIVFFVDSASLDHVARMRLADGREAGFVEWLGRDGCNPLALIDEGERLELEQRLHEL